METLQKEENELLEQLMVKFEVAKKVQNEELNNIELCMNYYAGKQLSRNAKETDLVFNNITPIILSGISTLLSSPLTIELIPRSLKDEKKVKQLERVLRFYWEHRLNMEEKLEELLLTLKVKGTAFLSIFMECENKLPELKVNVLQPETIFPDPTSNEIQEGEYIMQIIPLPLVKVYRMFPTQGHLVEEEYMSPKQSSMLNISGSKKTDILSPGITGGNQKAFIPQTILRIAYLKDDTKEEIKQYRFSIPICPFCGKKSAEIWGEKIEEIKCSHCFKIVKTKYIIQDNKSRVEIREKYPRGRRIIFTRTKILDDRPNPYLRFPYVAFKNINIFKLWGLSDVEYLLSDQIAINKMASVINRLLQLHGRPPLIKDRNAEVKINTESGKIEPGCDIIKNAGGNLAWMIPPPINFDMFRLMLDYIKQMDNKTGLRDRVRSKTATETQILEEEELRRQTMLLKHVGLKETVEQILFLLTNYHVLSESIALDYKKKEYVLFRGTDYQELLFDVYVKFSTDQIPSRLVRNNQILQMFQAGLITSQEARELMDLPIKEKLNNISQLNLAS